MGDPRGAPRLNNQSDRVSILGVGTSKDRSGSIRSDPGGDPDRSAKLWIIAEPGSRCHTSFVRATSRFLLLIYAKTILRFLDLVVVLLLLLFPFFAFLDLSSDFRVYNSKTSFRWWRGNLHATTSKSAHLDFNVPLAQQQYEVPANC
jgi:hypothetical protein